ncbi:hypothetical protein B0E33_11470 [Roseibium algicola]|uniref:Uncharacterized protein n=1 Tax=Roseibium algicola TaxID=2857014 RepID=A0ABM6I1A0_9HYPH|nr:hypothetical protein [Roseibium aggregatum]AQQ04134.1 hypothetical protein B0E33_11470 [Roseibium aggregatum]
MLKKALVALAVTVFGILPSTVTAKERNEIAIFLVIENGGVVTDRKAAETSINYLLGELVKFRRRRATKHALIHIVLSANPTEVTWSGTPAQLYEQGHTVLELIKFKDTCSDLVLAWEQVELTTRITMPDEIRLIGVGPMINASFPCDEGDTTIKLPQPAPKKLALAELAKKASQITLLNVHADQDAVYLNYLQKAGILRRAKKGEIEFDLMDAARTRAANGKILEGR